MTAQMVAQTKDVLREAISVYTSAGYREVAPFNHEPYADHWFAKALERPPSAFAIGSEIRIGGIRG